MTGFNSTDQYDNATVDNWPMTMDGQTGYRVIGGKAICGASAVTWVPILGGVSSYIERLSTGLYQVTWEEPFISTPAIMLNSFLAGFNSQVKCYEVTVSGAKIATSSYVGAAWGLVNTNDFWIAAVGR